MNKISLLLLEYLSPPLALNLAQDILATGIHPTGIGHDIKTSTGELEKEVDEFKRRQFLNTPDHRGFERLGSIDHGDD
jgi:hypothetical protein